MTARSGPPPELVERQAGGSTGGADRPGTLWAGTIPGGLFRSDDRGASWRLNRELWERPERAQWFGGGSTIPASIPSASTHATVATSPSRCLAAASGRATTTAAAGPAPPEACAPTTCRRSRARRRRSRTRTAWCSARRARSSSGCSNQRHLPFPRRRPALAGRGRRASPASASPSPCIRGSRTRPGSSRRPGRMPHSQDARFVVSPAPATVATASRPSSAACPMARPTTWSTATAWTSTPAASAWPWARPPAACGSARTGGEDWQQLSANLPPIYCVRFA